MLASGNPRVQCNPELSGPRLYQLRGDEGNLTLRPRSQENKAAGQYGTATPAQGHVWAFLVCSLDLVLRAAIIQHRDNSEGQQEGSRQLRVGLQRLPPVPAWPVSTVECQQKECKIRSPRAHDQRQTLNLRVPGSDFSHLPSEQPAVPPERRHSPLGEQQEGQLGLRQLLGLDLKEETGCRRARGSLGCHFSTTGNSSRSCTAPCPGPQPLRLEWPGPA